MNSHVAKARKIAFCVSTLTLVWTMVLVFVVAVSLAVIALIIVFNYRSEFIAAQLILQNGTNQLQDSQELRNELYQASSEIQLLQIQLNDSKNQIQALRAQLSQVNLTAQQLVSRDLEYQIQLNNLQSQMNETRSIFEARISEQESNVSLLIQDLQTVQFIIDELEPFYLGTENNPAASCQEISRCRPSGEYWVQVDNSSSPVQVYCDINRTTCCNTSSNWMRIGYLNMTDPKQTCPEGFELVNRTEPPLRTCGRPEPPGCVSTFYQSHGIEYTQVCGRIIAYQEAIPNGFGPSVHGLNDIERGYIDGVSLTHGHSPRQHIWTFAAAGNDVGSSTTNACPCIRSPFTGAIPSPVSNDSYFCDTGSREMPQIGTFYANDPLWDGQGCGGTSTCCGFNNPPWFCKQLSQSTTDDIELRLCANAVDVSQEDSPIELVEIYIK